MTERWIIILPLYRKLDRLMRLCSHAKWLVCMIGNWLEPYSNYINTGQMTAGAGNTLPGSRNTDSPQRGCMHIASKHGLYSIYFWTCIHNLQFTFSLSTLVHVNHSPLSSISRSVSYHFTLVHVNHSPLSSISRSVSYPLSTDGSSAKYRLMSLLAFSISSSSSDESASSCSGIVSSSSSSETYI